MIRVLICHHKSYHMIMYVCMYVYGYYIVLKIVPIHTYRGAKRIGSFV